MTRSRDASTGDLFVDIPQPAPAMPGAMDYRGELSVLVSDLLAAARLRDPRTCDRYGIAAAMSRLTDHDVSKLMLDGYTSAAREAFNLPLWLVPALEVACDTTAITEWLAAKRGGRILLGAAAIDAEIGRLEGERELANDKLRELRDLRRRIR